LKKSQGNDRNFIDLADCGPINEWTHSAGGVEAILTHQPGVDGLGQHGGKAVVHALLHQQPIRGDARLTRIAELLTTHIRLY